MLNNYAGKPLHIFGHSMGGMIAIRASIRFPDMFSGMVLVRRVLMWWWCRGTRSPARSQETSSSSSRRRSTPHSRDTART